jgi:hypothetical protein
MSGLTRERLLQVKALTEDPMLGVHAIVDMEDAELLALLDAALVLRRAQEWLLSAPTFDRCVEVQGPHSLATCRDIELTLYYGCHHGTTESVAAYSFAPDLLFAWKSALDKAEEAK